MESLNERDEVIRKYLLDQLDEATAEEFDEKLLMEPEFFEMISIVEQELLDDFVSGRLTLEEQSRVNFFYNSSEINKKKLDFALIVRDIARNAPQLVEPKKDLIPFADKSPQSKSELDNKVDDVSLGTTKPLINRIREIFSRNRILVIATCILVFAGGMMLMFWNPFSGGRQSLEHELSEINRAEQDIFKQYSGRLIEKNLESDIPRDIGVAMPNIEVTENADQIIYLKLSFLTNRSNIYRADFSDDAGKELFSVSDLKSQIGADNLPFVRILIPARFFRAGEFTINLRGKSEDGTMIESGSFIFRITKK